MGPLANMNLRQLEAFRATMRSGSITAAASMMHISQPSVSRLIADLERSVGFPLFSRSGRGLSPTLEAKSFYKGVEDIFVGTDRLAELAEAIRTTNADTIRIGTIPSIAPIELPKAVNVLYQRLPDIRFSIQSRNTPAILDAVQTHQLDIGIVGRQPPYDGVEVLFQTAAPYVCLMPEDHPLATERGPVDLLKLAETEEFVTPGDTFPIEMMSMATALAEKMKGRSRLSATNMPVSASLVRQTGVLAIADPFSAEQAVSMGGVVFRPVQQNLTYHVSIVGLRRERLSRAALEFVEILSRQLDQRVADVQNY
jgi:DNA-binding transcriptional LysR family regulator